MHYSKLHILVGSSDSSGSEIKNEELKGNEMAKEEPEEIEMAKEKVEGSEIKNEELKGNEMAKEELEEIEMAKEELQGNEMAKEELEDMKILIKRLKEIEMAKEVLQGNEMAKEELEDMKILIKILKHCGHLLDIEMAKEELEGSEMKNEELKGNEMAKEEPEGSEMKNEELKGNEMAKEELEDIEMAKEELEGSEMKNEELKGNEMAKEEPEGSEMKNEELKGNEMAKEELEGNEMWKEESALRLSVGKLCVHLLISKEFPYILDDLKRFITTLESTSTITVSLEQNEQIVRGLIEQQIERRRMEIERRRMLPLLLMTEIERTRKNERQIEMQRMIYIFFFNAGRHYADFQVHETCFPGSPHLQQNERQIEMQRMKRQMIIMKRQRKEPATREPNNEQLASPAICKSAAFSNSCSWLPKISSTTTDLYFFFQRWSALCRFSSSRNLLSRLTSPTTGIQSEPAVRYGGGCKEDLSSLLTLPINGLAT